MSAPNLESNMIPGRLRDPSLLYEELPSALALLTQRQKSLECRDLVAPILERMPSELATLFLKPRAVMFRQVLTPMQDVLVFLKKAHESGLGALILEYHDDLFVSAGNRYKRSLGKLPLYQYTGPDGRDMIRYQTIIDFNAYTGKKIRDVKCKDGRTLIETHHELFTKVTGIEVTDIAIDASSWFTSLGEEATCYYEYLLTLFVRNGILFEILVNNHSDDQFVQEVVVPAFHAVEAKFNTHPLIVRLSTQEEESRLFWDCYPKEVEELLNLRSI